MEALHFMQAVLLGCLSDSAVLSLTPLAQRSMMASAPL